MRVEEIQVRGMNDIPDIQRKTFRFVRDGKVLMLEYTPITQTQREQVVALFPPPIPPQKELFPQKNSREKAELQARGVQLVFKDYEDPTYLEASSKRDIYIALEIVRVGLGWEMTPAEFQEQISRKLKAGELQALMREVADESFSSISGDLVDAFLENLNPSTSEEENSDPSSKNTRSRKTRKPIGELPSDSTS